MKIDKEKEIITDLALHRTLKTIIDGVCLEDAVDGFKTEEVKGRTVLERKAKIEESESSGSFILSNKFKKREITVKYTLKADSYKKLMRRCELLNYYLDTEDDVNMLFTDDKFSYKGQVTEVNKVEETNTSVIGEFKIICPDFKKYGETIVIQNLKKFNYDLFYPIIPEKIIVRVNNRSDRVRIENNRSKKAIILESDFKGNEVIEIYPLRQEIRKDNRNFLQVLNITSNLEDFEILVGDTVSTENCTIDIEFKEMKI